MSETIPSATAASGTSMTERNVRAMTAVQLLEEGRALLHHATNERYDAIEGELRRRFWCGPCQAGRYSDCMKRRHKRDAICGMRTWYELAGVRRG